MPDVDFEFATGHMLFWLRDDRWMNSGEPQNRIGRQSLSGCGVCRIEMTIQQKKPAEMASFLVGVSRRLNLAVARLLCLRFYL